MEIPAQDLKNPVMEGFLEKRRPSKRYLSLKYQKRWCVIHQDKFYYYESNTDKKQKGVFSLEGYTFIEMENRLTFDLKCAGQRTFEFVCSSNAELKQWRKAIKTASMYNIGPTGKKKREPEVPLPPSSSAEQEDDIFADPTEIKKHLQRTHSRDVMDGQQDQAEVKKQLERSNSKENVLDRRPIPSPRMTRRHHHHHGKRHDNPKGRRSKHHNRHPMPSPDASSIASPNKQSIDEEDGYITVNKGGPRKIITNKQSIDEEDGYITVNKGGPRKVIKNNGSVDEEDGYITVNKDGPRKVIKHSDLVKDQSFQNSNSHAVPDDNGNEALYLELLGDNQLPSNNGPIKQNSTETLPQDPIYQNTNDPILQYSAVLPKKMRDVQIESHYATANTNNDVISDSDEYTSSSDDESSGSELDDYENAQMFGLSQNVH